MIRRKRRSPMACETFEACAQLLDAQSSLRVDRARRFRSIDVLTTNDDLGLDHGAGRLRHTTHATPHQVRSVKRARSLIGTLTEVAILMGRLDRRGITLLN